MEENKDINMESSNGDEEIIYTGSSNPQINEFEPSITNISQFGDIKAWIYSRTSHRFMQFLINDQLSEEYASLQDKMTEMHLTMTPVQLMK